MPILFPFAEARHYRLCARAEFGCGLDKAFVEPHPYGSLVFKVFFLVVWIRRYVEPLHFKFLLLQSIGLWG